MAVSILVCNLALGELRADPIAAIDEASLGARECARYYPHCLKLMLEFYDWSFTKAITTLAPLAVNPRSSEWAYAYALPADCATAIRLIVPGSGGYVEAGIYPGNSNLEMTEGGDFEVRE